MKLKIKAVSDKIGKDIPYPFYATAGAAAMDLCACVDAPVEVAPRALVSIPTGIAIALPSAEYVALVFARSGLGIKHGIALSNGVGVIDSDYRGEIRVGLTNLSDTPYTVQPGDRIAQLAVMPVVQAELERVDSLDDTGRGEERHTVSEETTVAFRELSEEEISCYIQTGEPMDKAGAYGIQGFGALLIEGIQGDYYNVMGLPVCRLGGILRQLGVDCLRLAAGERDSD